jgi:hypothetical protein
MVDSSLNKKISEWDYDICVAVDDEKGRRIGLCSAGDIVSDIEGWLKFLEEQKCDIIFCACRIKEETVDAVEKMAGDAYAIVWTAPYSADEPTEFQKKLNLKKADDLIEFIDWIEK